LNRVKRDIVLHVNDFVIPLNNVTAEEEEQSREG
jgi:hypothetical protein